MSKNSFMEKLSFYLSFYFSNDDSENILNDYEEWFENEASHGKSEEDICLALQPPQKIVKNMFSESGGNSINLSILLQNHIVQTSLLLLTHFAISALLLRYCNKYAADYVYSALCINFIYFIVGLFIVKGGQTRLPDLRCKSYKNKMYLPVLDLAVLIIFATPLFINRSSYVYIGVLYNVVINILALILLAINLYLNTKILQAKPVIFLRMFHLSGMITLLLFFINQTHLIDGLSSGYICGSIAIYAEIVILQVFFYLAKIRTGK